MQKDLDIPVDIHSKLREALDIFEELDCHRNLHSAVAIFLFVASAGVGIRAFFMMSDIAAWLELGEFEMLAMISLSWLIIFVVWILAFLLILTLLETMGVRDLRSVTKNRLSSMALERDALLELQKLMAGQNWKHETIFRSVISDLTENKA